MRKCIQPLIQRYPECAGVFPSYVLGHRASRNRSPLPVKMTIRDERSGRSRPEQIHFSTMVLEWVKSQGRRRLVVNGRVGGKVPSVVGVVAAIVEHTRRNLTVTGALWMPQSADKRDNRSVGNHNDDDHDARRRTNSTNTGRASKRATTTVSDCE